MPKKQTIQNRSLLLHKKHRGKIETHPKLDLLKKGVLEAAYTPGVAAVSELLAKKPVLSREYTFKGNSVAVVSDGSSVLGLGNIGPYGAYPVMEGKALIFKSCADIDAVPILLNTQDPKEIIETVCAIAPSFGGINLEDIARPHCFTIERALIERLDIPVMHDDQHGTAIGVLAGLINAAKVVRKDVQSLRVVISGAGAAGTATALLLVSYGIRNVVVLDSKGIIHKERNDLDVWKQELAETTNPDHRTGSLEDAVQGTDALIGLSGRGSKGFSKLLIRKMHERAIVFALANPKPEIMPEAASEAGAMVVATGRSDFKNQINNALVFPGVFRGALDGNIRTITVSMRLRAAEALAGLVPRPTPNSILPHATDPRAVRAIRHAIMRLT